MKSVVARKLSELKEKDGKLHFIVFEWVWKAENNENNLQDVLPKIWKPYINEVLDQM